MLSAELLGSFFHHRNNRCGKITWLTLADAGSCIALLSELGAIVRWVYFRPSIRTMTPQKVNSTEDWADTIRCLRSDRDMVNRRLPVLLKYLNIDSPRVPLIDVVDNGAVSEEVARAELSGLREACGSVMELLFQEVFKRGELPPGWVIDEGWPESSITGIADLAEHIEAIVGDYPISPAFDDNIRVVKRAIRNAKIATEWWGKSCIPQSLLDELPSGTEVNFDWAYKQMAIAKAQNEGSAEDAIKNLDLSAAEAKERIVELMNGFEMFAEEYTESECEGLQETAEEVIWILRNQQADDEIAEFEAASPGDKKIKMEKALEFIRSRRGVSRKKVAEHIGVEVETLARHYVPELKEKGVVSTPAGYVLPKGNGDR